MKDNSWREFQSVKAPQVRVKLWRIFTIKSWGILFGKLKIKNEKN